jgi:hypothetical protein
LLVIDAAAVRAPARGSEIDSRVRVGVRVRFRVRVRVRVRVRAHLRARGSKIDSRATEMGTTGNMGGAE